MHAVFPAVDAVAVSSAFYGEGSGPILLNSLHCSGAEANVLECTFGSDTSLCSHAQDVGVQCTGTYNLSIPCQLHTL